MKIHPCKVFILAFFLAIKLCSSLLSSLFLRSLLINAYLALPLLQSEQFVLIKSLSRIEFCGSRLSLFEKKVPHGKVFKNVLNHFRVDYSIPALREQECVSALCSFPHNGIMNGITKSLSFWRDCASWTMSRSMYRGFDALYASEQ